MKKLLATLGVTAAIVSAPLRAETVKLGSDFTYPPFNYKNEQQVPVGFDIEIADALCAEAKLECEWVTIGWDGLIPGLQARKIDVIMASMRITEERQKRVLFTDRYYNTPAQFAGHQNKTFEITAAGLSGLRIGVQRGTIHDQYVTDKYGNTAEIVRYSGQDEVYQELVNERLDLVFANSDQLALSFLNTEQGAAFDFVGEPVTEEKYIGQGTALAVRLRDKDLAEKFNDAIETILENGTYDEIASRYFTFDIYGE